MSHKPSDTFCATIRIGGMTCASCELLLERKLTHVQGIIAVDVNHKKGTAVITAHPDLLPDEQHIAKTIQKAGYSMLQEGEISSASISHDKRKWIEIGAALL